MKAQNPNKHPHKREGNIIYWFTGRKWLVRETCDDETKAKKLEKEIKDRQKNE